MHVYLTINGFLIYYNTIFVIVCIKLVDFSLNDEIVWLKDNILFTLTLIS